jgi:adenylate kinase
VTVSPANYAATRIVILGKQGSGKGTQADRLSTIYGVPHVSTGEAFRAAVKVGSDLGHMVQGYLDTGELVPDGVVVDVIREHLFGPAGPAGFILDGFPRTVAQAEALAEMAGARGIDFVVNLEVGTEEVLRRLAGRRVCANCGTGFNLVGNPPKVDGVCDTCGGPLLRRDDDTEEAIRRRLELYESVTAPLVDWYRQRGLLISVDAAAPPEDVTERVVKAIEAARAR